MALIHDFMSEQEMENIKQFVRYDVKRMVGWYQAVCQEGGQAVCQVGGQADVR